MSLADVGLMLPITGCGPVPKCSCIVAVDIVCGGGGGSCGFCGGATSAECEGFAGAAKGDSLCGSECVVWLLPAPVPVAVPVLGDVGGDKGDVAGDGGAVVLLPLDIAAGARR